MAVGEDVTVKIGVDAGNLNQGLNQSQAKVQTWANGIERMSQGPRSALYGLMHLNPYTALAGSIALVGGAIAGAAAKFSAFLNDMKKTADALDITTDAYQRFQYAANRSNVGMDKVSTFLTRFTSKLEEARSGTKEAVKLFDRLGLSVSDLSKKTPDQAFNAMLSKLAQMKKLGQDTSKIIENIFGRRAVMDINKMIAGGFLEDQAGAPVIDKKSFEEAEQMQNEWETIKQTFSKLAGAVVNATGIFRNLNEELIIFGNTLKNVLNVEPAPLENQTKRQWEEDVNSAYASVLLSDEKFGLNDKIKKQQEIQTKLDAAEKEIEKAELTGNPRAVDKAIKKAEKLQKDLNKVNKKIEDIIDDMFETLVGQFNTNPRLKQVFNDNDVKKSVKEMLTKNVELNSDLIERNFKGRIAEPSTPPEVINEDNSHYIYQKLNEDFDAYAQNAEVERKLKLASIQTTKDNIKAAEAEVQILKKLNELRKAGVDISEEEFRERLGSVNTLTEPKNEMDRWFLNVKEEIRKASENKYKEAQLNRIKQETEARKQLTNELYEVHDKYGLNHREIVEYNAMKKAFDVGMNYDQTEAYVDYAKEDDRFKWLNGLNIQGFRQDVFTNDLARRGGFSSSVTTWEKSSNDKVLEWLKIINDSEKSRNTKLDSLLDVLRD